MAGRHARPGAPSTTSTVGAKPGRHVAPTRTFVGTPLSVDGVTRDAMGAASLLGSSIPKGLTAALMGAAHGAAANDLTASQALAQSNIAVTMANLDAISKSRAIRSVSRNAEGVAPTATPLQVEAPRIMAFGRGPRVVVQGMVAGDIARIVSEFERRGYTINRSFVPPRLDPMSVYSYWRMEDVVVTGDIPADAKARIAARYERGTTVWTDIAAIGTKPTNTPRPGVTY